MQEYDCVSLFRTPLVVEEPGLQFDSIFGFQSHFLVLHATFCGFLVPGWILLDELYRLSGHVQDRLLHDVDVQQE